MPKFCSNIDNVPRLNASENCSKEALIFFRVFNHKEDEAGVGVVRNPSPWVRKVELVAVMVGARVCTETRQRPHVPNHFNVTDFVYIITQYPGATELRLLLIYFVSWQTEGRQNACVNIIKIKIFAHGWCGEMFKKNA